MTLSHPEHNFRARRPESPAGADILAYLRDRARKGGRNKRREADCARLLPMISCNSRSCHNQLLQQSSSNIELLLCYLHFYVLPSFAVPSAFASAWCQPPGGQLELIEKGYCMTCVSLRYTVVIGYRPKPVMLM